MNRSYAIIQISVLAGILAFAALFPSTSTAQNTSNEKTNTQKQALFERLATAPDEKSGRRAEADIWNFWLDQSPTPHVRKSIDAGMERREAYDFEAAENHFNDAVSAAPDYAEGWNQRAYIRFLRERPEDALSDLEKTLELEPLHFGALSGMYHVLRLQNRHAAAIRFLQRAVEIHPWIQERYALPEDMWPENYRKIHQPGQKT